MDIPCTIPIDMEIVDATFSGEALSFGHCKGTDRKHVLTIYVMIKDGQKFYHSYDVTSILHESQASRDILLDIDGLNLPESVEGGVGTGLDSWTEIKTDIKL